MKYLSALIASFVTLIGCAPSDAEISRVQDSGRDWLRDAAAAWGEDDSGTDEDSGTDRGLDTPESSGATRPIFVGELQNARDLGGVSAGKGAHVAFDRLFRGPPLVLSPFGCNAFTQLEIRTIIDLRTEDERLAKPDAACATNAARVVLAPLPVPYNVSPADYIADLYARPSIVAVFAALGDRASYPVYFHCTWGRDRTGVLAAVILLALGASHDAIMHEYLLSQATVGAYPDSLAAVLDEVERVGGIDAYLTSIGVTANQVATLRARALAH